MSKIVQFLKEVRTEIKKVTWPHRKEVINSTTVVLITVFFIAFFLWIVDISLQGIVSRIIRF